MRSAVLERIDPRYTFSRRIEAEVDPLSRPATIANTVRGPRRVDCQDAHCGGRQFVVHKHAARRLHYDFRLEADGVLKSWAVPRGPSTNPRDKRLAIRTEDHPIEYADFEGTIPAGQYGAGTVIIWDAGTYDNLTNDNAGAEIPVAEAIQRGHLALFLRGHKLIGGYALTRIGPADGRERWLLVKEADRFADTTRDPVQRQPESVKSGRVNDELTPSTG
jgi:DNA ligase D-like protein (predicted 3'-phosphoesterase)